jgi:hypothetical protein
MMLSREDEDRRRASMLGSGSPSMHPTPAEMDVAVHSTDDTDGIFTLDDDSARAPSFTQALMSPVLRPSSGASSSRHHDHTHHITRSLSSSSNSDEEASSASASSRAWGNPRLNSTVGYSGGVSPIPMGAYHRLGTPRSTATPGSSFDGPEAFPAMGSSSGTPIHSVSSLQLSGSWSKGSPSNSLLGTSSQGNSVSGDMNRTSSSVSSSPVAGARSSVLAPAAAPPNNGRRSRAEEEEEELRYVLELSLAESRSRGAE